AQPPATRRLVLRAMAQSRVTKIPDSWLAAVTSILAGNDCEQIADTVSAIRALVNPKEPVKSLAEPLRKVGNNDQAPAPARLTALAAMPGGLPNVEPS